MSKKKSQLNSSLTCNNIPPMASIWANTTYTAQTISTREHKSMTLDELFSLLENIEKRLSKIEERLCILDRDIRKDDAEALKNAYDEYLLVEALVKENIEKGNDNA